MAKPGLTDTERQRIAALHAEGASCSAIARDLDRAASTVSRHAAAMDLSWSSERTAAATEAKQATNQARRAELVRRLYDRADKIMDRLDADQFKLVGMDKDGYAHTNVVDADAIPGTEERALFGMVVNGLTAAARLEQVDAAQSNTGEARGILGGLQDALQSAYGQLAHTGTPTGLAAEAELDAGP